MSLTASDCTSYLRRADIGPVHLEGHAVLDVALGPATLVSGSSAVPRRILVDCADTARFVVFGAVQFVLPTAERHGDPAVREAVTSQLVTGRRPN